MKQPLNALSGREGGTSNPSGHFTPPREEGVQSCARAFYKKRSAWLDHSLHCLKANKLNCFILSNPQKSPF
jgi:hypothetical protein